MSELKITQKSLENAILKDGQIVSGYVSAGEIKSSGSGAVAIGFANDYGQIIADGSGVLAIGAVKGLGRPTLNNAIIYASGQGSIATGFVQQSGQIYASGQGSITTGFVQIGGQICTDVSSRGAFVNGYASGRGEIIAKGYGAHAEGYAAEQYLTGHDKIEASGNGAHAEGWNTTASSEAAHAEGRNTSANGNYSHAEGYGTTASSEAAHAEGYDTSALGDGAHAEGILTCAQGSGSHAEGKNTAAGNTYAYITNASANGNIYSPAANIIYVKSTGKFSINDTIGLSINTSLYTITSINNAPPAIYLNEGLSNIDANKVNQDTSIYKVVDYTAHAEGIGTIASGNGSHASGIGTIAEHEAMTAIGTYNNTSTDAYFVVGNGDSNNRKDAFVVKTNGDVLINPFNSSLLISLYDLICRVSPHLIYTSNDNNIVSPPISSLPQIISNTYSNGYGIMVFDTSCSSIGNFNDCNNLISIIIPNTVTSIVHGAFSNCSSLTSIVVENGNTKYDSRNNCNAIIETVTNTLISGCQKTTIPNSITSIGESAFYWCFTLTSITIPNSVTSIGNGAFNMCSALTSITIPNSVTSIGSGAFIHCSDLTSIEIPNSVTSIGDQAFAGCCKLESITCMRTEPPILGDAVFTNTNNCNIYVPNDYVGRYKNNWPTYEDRIFPMKINIIKV